MDLVDLEPQYSTNEIAGKCVRCLAEQELSNCIIEMLGDKADDDKLQQKYNILVTFLKSPEAQDLINETEQYLSDGIKVKVSLYFEQNSLKYKINKQ